MRDVPKAITNLLNRTHIKIHVQQESKWVSLLITLSARSRLVINLFCFNIAAIGVTCVCVLSAHSLRILSCHLFAMYLSV